MQKYELEYYESIGNWNFDEIRYESEKITNWDFYEKIKENTNENSICLDLGTGGGERVLKNYPNVGMIIATDFSQEMLKTAKENSKKYPNRNIKFAWMDNLEMTFPKESFNLISARHTIINAKQIYDCLTEKGVLVVEGVDKFDCWELKEIFNRGQAYKDKTAISEKDYSDLKNAGFKQIEKVKIFENEYYKTEKDLMALLLKAPILDNFLKIENKQMIEKDLFNKYVSEYKTEKGILLKRVLYGIVAKK
ncbi:MAG: methyltransferase domain-containing protein [Clostridiales bacterium]|nr:methyltransferase domain-containing protein [Clostridiales bacterium]